MQDAIFLHQGFHIRLLSSLSFLCRDFLGQIPARLQTFLREVGAAAAPPEISGRRGQDECRRHSLSPQRMEQGGADEQPVL